MRWIGSIILPIVFLIIAVIGIIFKPQKNLYFGYRTNKTISDEEVWKNANSYFFKTLLILDVFLLLPLSLIMAFFINSVLILVLSNIGASILFLVFVIVLTERKIKKRIKKND